MYVEIGNPSVITEGFYYDRHMSRVVIYLFQG